MGKTFLIWLAIGFSSVVGAKNLANGQVYTVPSYEVWSIAAIDKNPCKVCTADIYVRSGSVEINGIWVSGSFSFSVVDSSEIVFSGNTVFALGDVVNSVSIDVVNSKS